MATANNKIKGLIAKNDDRSYPERTQMEFQTQMEQTPIDILQLGNNAALNEIRAATARFL